MALSREQLPRSNDDTSKGFAKTIRCKVLGRLRLECIHIKILQEDWYHYASSKTVKGYGELSIIVHPDSDESPNWSEVVRRAESKLAPLLRKERSIRKAAIPGIRKRLKACGYATSNSDDSVMAAMRLHQIMFIGTTEFQLSYSGSKELFHCLDILLLVGPRFGLRASQFDG